MKRKYVIGLLAAAGISVLASGVSAEDLEEAIIVEESAIADVLVTDDLNMDDTAAEENQDSLSDSSEEAESETEAYCSEEAESETEADRPEETEYITETEFSEETKIQSEAEELADTLNDTLVAVEVLDEFEDIVEETTVPEISGACGEALNWHISEEKTLVISGTGEMYDASLEQEAPWKQYSPQIQEVVVEEGVTSLGCYAFNGMDQIKMIKLPASLSWIGDGAFRDCSVLETIEVDSENRSFAVYEQVLYSQDGSELICYPQQLKASAYETLVTLTAISKYAFYGQDYLEVLKIPETLLVIGDNAFAECTSLAEISIL